MRPSDVFGCAIVCMCGFTWMTQSMYTVMNCSFLKLRQWVVIWRIYVGKCASVMAIYLIQSRLDLVCWVLVLTFEFFHSCLCVALLYVRCMYDFGILWAVAWRLWRGGMRCMLAVRLRSSNMTMMLFYDLFIIVGSIEGTFCKIKFIKILYKKFNRKVSHIGYWTRSSENYIH